jgi:transcriptional regulator of heat shock response
MSNTTLIFKNINVQGSQFAVGVIGPRRMNYQKVIDMINSLANRIDLMYSDNNDIKALPEHND